MKGKQKNRYYGIKTNFIKFEKIPRNRIPRYLFWPCAKINNAEHLIAEFKFRGSAEFWRSALLTWPASMCKFRSQGKLAQGM